MNEINTFDFGDITREEDYNPTDYSLAGAGDIVIPTLKRPAFSPIWLVDQGIDDYTKWACVPLNCYLSACTTWNFKPSWGYFMELLKELETAGLRTPGVGASLPKVIDFLRKKWNKDFPKYQITYYRDLYNDPIIKEALSKAYRVVLRYAVTTSYSKDRDDNLIIDKTSYGETEKYGHIVSLMFSKAIKGKELKAYHPSKEETTFTIPDKGDGLYIFDSYPFKRPKSCVYQINTLKDLIKNGVYSQWAYTILRK